MGGKGDVSGRERRKKYQINQTHVPGSVCMMRNPIGKKGKEGRDRQKDGSVIDHGPWIFYSLFDAFIRVFSAVFS